MTLKRAQKTPGASMAKRLRSYGLLSGGAVLAASVVVGLFVDWSAGVRASGVLIPCGDVQLVRATQSSPLVFLGPEPGSAVAAGEILLATAASAEIDQVAELQSYLDRLNILAASDQVVESPPQTPDLFEINAELAVLRQAVVDLNVLRDRTELAQALARNAAALDAARREVNALSDVVSAATRRARRVEEQLQRAQRHFNDGLLARRDLESIEERSATAEIDLRRNVGDLAAREAELVRLEAEAERLSDDRSNAVVRQTRLLEIAAIQVESALSSWRETNLYLAERAGQVHFTGAARTGVTTQLGQVLAVVGGQQEGHGALLDVQLNASQPPSVGDHAALEVPRRIGEPATLIRGRVVEVAGVALESQISLVVELDEVFDWVHVDGSQLVPLQPVTGWVSTGRGSLVQRIMSQNSDRRTRPAHSRCRHV